MEQEERSRAGEAEASGEAGEKRGGLEKKKPKKQAQ